MSSLPGQLEGAQGVVQRGVDDGHQLVVDVGSVGGAREDRVRLGRAARCGQSPTARMPNDPATRVAGPPLCSREIDCEIRRYIKRHIAHELYRALITAVNPDTTASV